MHCRVYLAVSTNADNRGLMVQQGAVKVQLCSIDCVSSCELYLLWHVWMYVLIVNSVICAKKSCVGVFAMQLHVMQHTVLRRPFSPSIHISL